MIYTSVVLHYNERDYATYFYYLSSRLTRVDFLPHEEHICL